MSYTDIHYYLHYQSLGTAAYKDDAFMVLGIKEKKMEIPGNLLSMTIDS